MDLSELDLTGEPGRVTISSECFAAGDHNIFDVVFAGTYQSFFPPCQRYIHPERKEGGKIKLQTSNIKLQTSNIKHLHAPILVPPPVPAAHRLRRRG